MATSDEVDQIVQQAHVAFLGARGTEPSTRARWLEAVATGLDANAEELVRMGQAETNLAEGRLQGELKRTTFQLRLFAEEVLRGETLDATIDHADDSWGMGPRPDLRRMNVPLGVVGVFGASNFPFAFSVMGGDSASALAAGCAVVHKIHEAHLELGLRTAEIIVEALRGTGAPEDLFTVVTSRAAGESLVDHPLIKAIGFTGSTRVGTVLAQRAAARPEPIPFYGELGSINPVIVTPQAWETRSEEILIGFVDSYILGMGQFCTKPGLLFVPQLGEEGRQVLREAVAQNEPTPMLTPGLAEGFLSVRSAMAGREGLTELVPGGEGVAPGPALFTTTVDDVMKDPAIVREEMFGPASIVIQYRDEIELRNGLELLEGQLTTTIQGEPHEDVAHLMDALSALSGRVIWNSWPTGVTVSYAQHHGGPYPATTAPSTTSVGTAAARRFMRPVSYQGFPEASLPAALHESNPWSISRRVDGEWQSAAEGAK